MSMGQETPPATDCAVAAESLRLLCRNMPVAMCATLLCGLLLVVALHGTVAPLLLTVWFGLLAVAIGLRTGLVLRHEVTPDAVVEANPGRWGGYYTASSAFVGLLWGAAGALFLTPGSIAPETLVVITVLGVTAGAMATHGPYLPAFHAFALTALGPLIVALAWQSDTTHTVLALGAALYLAALVGGAHGLNQALIAALRLRHQNEDLIETLRRAGAAAETANRAKSDFLATMSHELRTPLTSVIGFAEILQAEPYGSLGDPRYRGYADDIHASGNHLLDLINDILDLSKAEAGKLQLSEDRFDLCRAVESAVRLVRERVQRAGLSLTVSLPPAPLVLYADERALKQVLLNLLSNSIKFTPSGGAITITAGLADTGALHLSVGDTGIGMRSEDIPTALGRYQQLDSTLAGRHRGSGLGLPLARTMAELHGGTFLLSSAPDTGTTATLCLPAVRVVRCPAP